MEQYLGFSSDKEVFDNLKSVRKQLSDLSNIEHILACSYIVNGVDKEINKLFSKFNSFVLSIMVVESDEYKYLSSTIYPTEDNDVTSSDDINDILINQFKQEQIEKYIESDSFEIFIDKTTYSKKYLKEKLLTNLLTAEQRKLLNYVQLDKEVKVKDSIDRKMKI